MTSVVCKVCVVMMSPSSCGGTVSGLYEGTGRVLARHPDKAPAGGKGDGLGAVIGAKLGEY
jgi:hypothetical protein